MSSIKGLCWFSGFPHRSRGHVWTCAKRHRCPSFCSVTLLQLGDGLFQTNPAIVVPSSIVSSPGLHALSRPMDTTAQLHYDHDKSGEMAPSCSAWPTLLIYVWSGHAPIMQLVMSIIISHANEKLIFDMLIIHINDCTTTEGSKVVIMHLSCTFQVLGKYMLAKHLKSAWQHSFPKLSITFGRLYCISWHNSRLLSHILVWWKTTIAYLGMLVHSCHLFWHGSRPLLHILARQ